MVALVAPAVGSSSMQARFCAGVEETGADGWATLSLGRGEGSDYLRTLQAVPPPEFELGSIVVEEHGRVVAAAPVFGTVYRFDTSFQGAWRRVGDRLYRHLPRLVSMKLLSLGSPLSDNCQVGFAADLSAERRAEALAELLACLKRQARKDGASLIAAKSLTSEEADEHQPAFSSCGYARVTTIPNVVLDLPFRNMDEYLSSLPEKTSSYLRRKWRASSKVTIEYRTSIEGLEGEINALYASTLAHSRVDYSNFGPVHADYFASLLRAMGERARLMLCWVDGELLSFQLYLVERDTVFAKGIGMKYPKARDYNLYFINWKEMIDYCLAHGLRRISMSGTTYSTKLLIGGRLERRWIFFRVRNRAMNTILPWLAPKFDFESNDPELRELDAGRAGSRP